jgi:hypothetical protein
MKIAYFLSGLWGLRGGGWTTESVRDSEIESLRLEKDERFVNTESMNCDYVNLWEFVRVERGRLDAEDEYCLLGLRNFVFIVPLTEPVRFG